MLNFTAGTEISGRYQLVRLLAFGGMSEVWSAHDLITQKQVALKVLKNNSELRDDSVRRFLREARAVSAVNHPNVVSVHNLLLYRGAPIMVMDLLQGESLERKLERETSI